MKWIIAYDIRDKRRLQKVYRHLRGYAFHLQNSVFLLNGERGLFDECLTKLKTIIATEDDIRIYELSNDTPIHHYGRALLPEGIVYPPLNIIEHRITDENEK